MKTVLYLSGHIAIWLGFAARGVLKDMYVEPVECINSERTGPSWLHESENTVELVVDSEHEEIESHPISSTSSLIKDKSNLLALRKKLISNYPKAIIKSVAGCRDSTAVVVQHINLSDVQRDWICELQNGNVTICSVRSATELLAGFFSIGLDSCLTFSCSDGFVKHTYCSDGSALFTRAINKVSSSHIATQINETLTHLQSSGLLLQPVPVFAVGMTEEQAGSVRELTLVKELTLAEESIAGSFESTIDAESFQPQAGLASRVVANRKIKTGDKYRHTTYLMEKHLMNMQNRQRYRLCVAAGMFMLVMITFSTYEYASKARYKQAIVSEKMAVQAATERYLAQARNISVNAEPISSILFDRLAWADQSGASPAVLLSGIAEALSGFDQLSLTQLSWRVREAVNQNSKSRQNRGLLQSPFSMRKELTYLAKPSVVDVQLSGRVSMAFSLTHQQESVVRFADALQASIGVSELRVEKAPLSRITNAQNSGHREVAEQPEFTLTFSVFEISRHG